MPVEEVTFNGRAYPAFQATGNAARFAMPFAREVCKGDGVDVGGGCWSWMFPGASLIDPGSANGLRDEDGRKYTATDFPHRNLDYVFSSHCLEHLPNWVDALDHWTAALRPGGVLFLYLPDFSQEYWRPWNNRKHVHVLTPETLRSYIVHRWNVNPRVSGVDLNNSFTVLAEKPLLERKDE